jgi:hypothetical protein
MNKDLVVVAPWRDRVANALMLVAVLAASFAFASSTRAVAAASPDTLVVEIWRMLGYLVFAAIYVLLAMRPRFHPGLWELSFFHRAGVALFLLAVAPGVSAGIAAVEAAIAAIIAASYFLAKGYLAWNVAEPDVISASDRVAERHLNPPSTRMV